VTFFKDLLKGRVGA
jgi:hypothetical protein